MNTKHHQTVTVAKVGRTPNRSCPILHQVGKRRPRDIQLPSAPQNDSEVDVTGDPIFTITRRELETVMGPLHTNITSPTSTTDVHADVSDEVDEDLSSLFATTSSGRLGDNVSSNKKGVSSASPRGKGKKAPQEKLLGVLDDGTILLVTGNALLSWTNSVATEVESVAGASAVTPTSLMHTIQKRLGARPSPLPVFYTTVWDALSYVHNTVLGSVDDFLSDASTRSSSRNLVVALRGSGATASGGFSRFTMVGMCVCSELSMAVRCFTSEHTPTSLDGSTDQESALSALSDRTTDDVWADEAVLLGDTRCSGCICGVHLVWVCKRSQGCGIASALIDACRKTLLFHHVIPRSQVAFSQPTRQGKMLALRYTNRRDFLTFV